MRVLIPLLQYAMCLAGFPKLLGGLERAEFLPHCFGYLRVFIERRMIAGRVDILGEELRLPILPSFAHLLECLPLEPILCFGWKCEPFLHCRPSSLFHLYNSTNNRNNKSHFIHLNNAIHPSEKRRNGGGWRHTWRSGVLGDGGAGRSR
ncbi:Os04g0580001, partial [Oryza sativa Japonica Group]